MAILVMTTFGKESHTWLEQKANLKKRMSLNWQDAILGEWPRLLRLFKEWDVDSSGGVTRREFLAGVRAMGVHVPKEGW